MMPRLWLAVCGLLVLAAPVPTRAQDIQVVPVTTTADLGYSLDRVRAGAPVPYIVAAQIPDDLRELRYSADRKDAFFKTVLPLILSVNDDILITRSYLLKINRLVASGGKLTNRERQWLKRLAEYYEVQPRRDGTLDLSDLIPRVDIIPPSLAMAQGAEESGFGTSRFASQGNALFGELTRDAAEGMSTKAPELQGTGYLVRAFLNIQASIYAYARNLNTHKAYEKFRERRAEMRLANQPIDPYSLAEELTPYCGCGPEYVTRLQNHIRQNALTDFDTATSAPNLAQIRGF